MPPSAGHTPSVGHTLRGTRKHLAKRAWIHQVKGTESGFYFYRVIGATEQILTEDIGQHWMQAWVWLDFSMRGGPSPNRPS